MALPTRRQDSELSSWDPIVGRFNYEVVLPGVEDDGEVSATMHEGVLTVRVPKPVRDRPRRIPIS